MSLMNDDALGVADQRRAFRDKLLKKMRDRNMRSIDLSKASDISKDSISSYVTMRSLPGKENLKKICTALKCKPSDLLNIDGENEVVMELRVDHRPNHNIVILRMPMPAAEAAKVFSQFVERRAALEKWDKENGED